MRYPVLFARFSEIAVSLILAGILMVAIASCSLLDTVTLSFSGTITRDIVAASGSPSDIQAAVNLVVAAGGGTVKIPAGTFTFNPPTNGIGVTIPWGAQNLNIIGAGIDQTILKETTNSGSSYMFATQNYGGFSTQTQAANVRISNMTLKGFVQTEATTLNTGIRIGWTRNWRVDHIKFLDFAGQAIHTSDNAGGTYHFYNSGVVDHCSFDNPYKATTTGTREGGYGVNIQGKDVSGTDYWENLGDCLGKFDTVMNTIVYIEDCTFSRCRHAIASNTGSWYVARYNFINWTIPLNYQGLDVHGPGYGSGGRGAEWYNNVVVGARWSDPPPTYAGHGGALRGGASFVYNNTFQDLNYGIRFWYENTWQDPPVPQRVVRDTFIWSNTYNNVNYYIVNESPGDIIANPSTKPTTGGWYYTRAPTQYLDGFTYTPYQYPHPLTID